ncbi:hypothetical protein ACEPAG_8179 [Sanghuangporus baumii]
MDYQALRDRFYNCALKYSSLLSEHYGPSGSTQPILKRKWTIDRAEVVEFSPRLKRAEKEMKEPRINCQSALEDLHRTPKLVDQPPRVTLPLELVQYIVALAFSESDLSDLREEDRGLESLLTFEHPAHNILLASTLMVDSYYFNDENPKWESLDDPQLQIPDGRLQVELNGMLTVHNEWVIRFARRFACRVKQLKFYTASELEQCGPVLPHLRYFAFELDRHSDVKNEVPNWDWLAKVVGSMERVELRSASIPGPFVEGFISSGYLRYISRLTIKLVCKEQAINEWPSPDEVLKVLPELTNLVSLTIGSIDTACPDIELGTAPDLMSHDTNRLYHNYSNGLHPKLPPLSQLRFDIEWDIALPFISKLPSYYLKELTIFEMFNPKRDKISASCNKLSELLFPNLEALWFPTLDLRKVLIKDDSTHNGKGSKIWNFPHLHTLDSRRADSPDSIQSLMDIVEVIKLRAAAAAQRHSACSDGPEELVEHINRLYMNLPEGRLSHLSRHFSQIREFGRKLGKPEYAFVRGTRTNCSESRGPAIRVRRS